MKRCVWRIQVVLVAAVLAAGCTSSGSSASSHASPDSAAPIIYAAIGASDGVGVGAEDRLRDAWPQVFFRTALPESAVLYNFSIPGATVVTALSEEDPVALSVDPMLVTVWLNVNDLIGRVSASDYESRLDRLVRDMRRGGKARVLVANTPYLDRLPAYLGCRAGTPPVGVTCPPGLADFGPAEINNAVDAYNSAIARVVREEGAILVDVHAQGEIPDAHPDWVGSDGFHPSAAGYAAIAAVFAAAWKRTGGAAA